MKVLPVSELDHVFHLIGKDWMLLTVAEKDRSSGKKANPMTASWGGMGILWNKPVIFLFVRPQRHTFGLLEASDRLSVSFFAEKFRGALRICGTLSGKDTDKFAAAGLTLTQMEGVPCPAEADLTLLCRKMYAGNLEEASFVDRALLSNYAEKDFHRMYICEIESVYQKDKS